MIEITANTRRAIVTNKELLTTGSAGIQVQFTLSEDWAGLAKVAVFRQGDEGEKVDCVLDSDLICVVPPEVLTTDDEVVFCGIYGSNGQGTIIIPTIWASLGVVRPGTEPNTPATAEPTPEIWAQILGVAQDAEQTANEAYTMAENAQGYIVEETVRNAVNTFVNTTVPAAEQAIADAQADAEQAVEDKGEEVLDSIPQDYSDLADDVADLSRQLSDAESAINALDPLVSGSLVTKNTSGNPLTITDAMVAQIAGLVVDIVPSQSGSGDSTPDNIRPLADVTSVDLTVNSDTITVSLDTGTESITGKRLGHLIVDDDGKVKFRAEYAIRKLTSFDGAWGAVTNGYAVYYYADSITHVSMDSKFMASSAFVFSNASNENYMPALSYGGRAGSSTVYTFILPATVTSLTAARTWLSTNFPNGIQYVAKLATPVEYNLQDVIINLDDRENTISSNSGSVDLTYYAKLENVLQTKADQTALESASDNIEAIQNIIQPDINAYDGIDNGWVIGSINNDGSEGGVSGNGRIRTGFIYLGEGSVIKNTQPGSYYHDIFYYTLAKTYVSRTDWITTPVTITEDCFVRIVMAKNVSGAITPEEIPTISAAEEIKRIFPQTELTGRAVTQEEFQDNAYIPPYFESQVKSAIASSEQNIASAGFNGDNFALISDLHWYKNEKKSPMLMRKVLEKINCDKIICAGDLIGGGNKNSEITEMQNCVSAFKNTRPFYVLFGNHDSNKMNAPTSDDYFSKSEFYAIAQKQTDNLVEYGVANYFYFDNPATKTRFICLDTGDNGIIDSSQKTWFENILSSVNANWHIIVFAHILYSASSWFIGMTLSDCTMTSSAEYVCTTLDTFNANNQDKKVEAIFGGHLHFDAESQTSGGIPIVLIDTDSTMTYSSTGASVGTINEQCFDIVCVDYTAEIIKCTRIGRGSDRTITY